MKKAMFLLLVVIFGCILTGSIYKTNVSLPIGNYVLAKSDEAIKPSVAIAKNNGFVFTYAAWSSYLGHGHYEVDGRFLWLKTDDGRHQSLFEMQDHALVFHSENLSMLQSGHTIPDGAVFQYAPPK